MIKKNRIKLAVDRLGNIPVPKIKKSNNSVTRYNELKEMEVEYKKITAFSSFEEMENEQLKHFATLSHEELLLNNKRMSKAAFGITGNSVKGDKDLKIKFKKEDEYIL